jgi:enterochelin esterase-like enzyme
MTRRQATAFSLRSALFLILSTLLLAACQPQAAPTGTAEPVSTVAVTPTPDEAAQATAEAALPSPTPDCRQQGGTLSSEMIFSEDLADYLLFDVYLPPCYEADAEVRYPVVYLLHGLSYQQDQWPRLGLTATLDALVAEGEISPFIAILPLEFPFTPPQVSMFGSALTTELIPWVDEHYRTLADKDYRAIGGVSRGAAWALRLGFERYDLFARVGAHSLPPFEADGSRMLTWMQFADEDLPLFFIDIGRNDQEKITAEAFADQLDWYAIPHEWYLFNGGHTEAYWSSHLEEYLRWYTADW